MGLQAWVVELGARLRNQNKHETTSEKTRCFSPSQPLSPQEMEVAFVKDMVRACSDLSAEVGVDFEIVGQDLRVFKYAGEGFDMRKVASTESLLSGASLRPASPVMPLVGVVGERPAGAVLPVRSAIGDTVTGKGTVQEVAMSAAPMGQVVPDKEQQQQTSSASMVLELAAEQQVDPRQATAPSLSSRMLCRKDFRPIKHLGRGCFGEVWLVLDTVSERYLAMKIINKAQTKPELYQLIFEEQRIGRELIGSKWLLAIEGSFEDEVNFYILMEYAAGGDLYTRVHDVGGLSEKALELILPEMVLAVEEMHKQEKIHRDLKLDNFLFDADGHLKLADFGISKAFGVAPEARPWEPCGSATDNVAPELANCKLTVTLAGTPGYAAPEVSSGKPYGFEADIFSLGVVFYKLIVGKLPFGVHCAMSVQQIAKRVETATLDFPAQVNSCIRHLIGMMLEKNPVARITLRELKAHPYFDAVNWKQVNFRKNTRERKDVVFRGELPQHVTLDTDLTRFPTGDVQTEIIHPWFWYAGSGLKRPGTPELQPVLPLRIRKRSQTQMPHNENASVATTSSLGEDNLNEMQQIRYRTARPSTSNDRRAHRVVMIYA